VNRFGLSEQTISSLKTVFSKFPEIEEIVLYGSRAKGNFRPGSDIDISLKGRELTTDHLLKIESEVEELFLPYKIDLSLYSKIENPDFIEHIDRVGIKFE